MLRQAFHPMRGLLDRKASRLAVLPVFLSKCRDTLFAISLLVPVAVCSPVIVALPSPLNPDVNLLTPSLTEATARPYLYKPLFGGMSSLPAINVALAPADNASSVDSTVFEAISAMLAENPTDNLTQESPAAGFEQYPYLLLTLGLILLALRPANPTLTGRH